MRKLSALFAILLVLALAGCRRALPPLPPTPVRTPIARSPRAISPENLAEVHILASSASGGNGPLAFSPDGRLLAAGACLLDAQTLAEVRCLPSGRVASAAFSPDSSLLAVGPEGATVRVWRVSDGELVRVLPDPGGWADSLAFVDDATLAAWDGLDVRTWQLADGTLMHSWGGLQPPRWNPEAPYWGANAALAPDGTTLGWMLKDRVRLSRADDGALLRDFGRHRWQGGRVVFSPDGSLLAVLSLGGIDLFRIADGARLPGYPRTDPGKSIALSPDGAILAAGTYRGGVAMSRVSDGALLRGLVGGHKDFVESLAFSPDGATLASGARDGTLCLWGLEP